MKFFLNILFLLSISACVSSSDKVKLSDAGASDNGRNEKDKPTPQDNIASPAPLGAVNFNIDTDGFISISDSQGSFNLPEAPEHRRRLKILLKNQTTQVTTVIDMDHVSSSVINGETNYVLEASSAPGIAIGLKVSTSNKVLKFNFSLPALTIPDMRITAASVRFDASSFRCEAASGFEGNVCGNEFVSFASICATSNCNSSTKIISGDEMPLDLLDRPGFVGDDLRNLGGAPFFGGEIVADRVKDLDGSQLHFFISSDSYRSIKFKKDLFNHTASIFNITPELYTSMIFAVFGPSTTNANAIDLQKIRTLGSTALSLGFRQVMLLQNAWNKSPGGFDPLDGFGDALRTLKFKGLNVALHQLVLGVSPVNPLYDPNKLLSYNGSPLFSAEYGGYFWDTTDSALVQDISQSYKVGLTKNLYNRLTIYQDGTEGYLPYQPINLVTLAPNAQSVRKSLYDDFSGVTGYRNHLSGLYQKIPGIHFQEALRGYRSSTIFQSPINDVWQVRNALDPNTYAHSMAIPRMVEDLKRGFVSQLGWIPFLPGNSEENIGLLLNTAVAMGAPIVVEAEPEEFNAPINETMILQLKNRLIVLNKMTGERELVEDSAHAIQVRHESNITGVGIFGAVAKGVKNGISGRAYGIDSGTEGSFFDGVNNDPNSTYPSTKLTSVGSRIVIPSHPTLKLKNEFTVSLKFKMALPLPNSEQKLVSKKQGFEIYAVRPGSGPAYIAGYLIPGLNNSVSAAAFSAAFGQANGPVADAWNHLAFTFDGANTKLFLNGALVATTSVPTNFRYSPDEAPLYLGREGPAKAQGNFLGTLRDFRVFAKALSSSEVAQENSASLTTQDPVAWLPLTSSHMQTTHTVSLSGSPEYHIAALDLDSRLEKISLEDLIPSSDCKAAWIPNFGLNPRNSRIVRSVTFNEQGQGSLDMTGMSLSPLSSSQLTFENCNFISPDP